MQTDVKHSGAHVDRFILKNVLEVKETIAAEAVLGKQTRTFGINDLWNIQRNAKTAAERVRRY